MNSLLWWLQTLTYSGASGRDASPALARSLPRSHDPIPVDPPPGTDFSLSTLPTLLLSFLYRPW